MTTNISHRARAERLAAALGIEVVVLSAHDGRRVVVTWPAGEGESATPTRIVTNAFTDDNGWRWAAEHVDRKAMESAPSLVAALDALRRAGDARVTAENGVETARRELAAAQEIHAGAVRDDLAARGAMARAIEAATPEQRAAFAALMEE